MVISDRGNKVTLRGPDNGHAHLRQGDHLPPFLIRKFMESGWRWRVVVEPNTKPAILTGNEAMAYCNELRSIARRIEADRGVNREGEHHNVKDCFTPVPVMQITERTTQPMIREAFTLGVKVFKVYPFMVTTNSEDGVRDYEKIYPALDTVENHGGIVQFHGEDPNSSVEGLRKEDAFIEKRLAPIRQKFSALKVSLEHITTASAVRWISSQDANTTVASVTIHHLMNTLDDVLGYSEKSGGLMCVHNGCKPQAKFRKDREALRAAATKGDRHFLYGGDDAPHQRREKKECLHAACGVWNTVAALPLLVELFEAYRALSHLEPFLSEHWADFYGYPRNKGIVTLVRDSWQVPREYSVPGIIGDGIVPFWFEQELKWRVINP